ncbi:MAG: hypothetical protein GY699_23950 [Desulfobacteraceae bacterium]|nr:hypothetical protein [Desulfobacteraceae bacterium]
MNEFCFLKQEMGIIILEKEIVMKKLFLLLILVSLLSFSTTISAAPFNANLLLNPSFEDELNHWATIYGNYNNYAPLNPVSGSWYLHGGDSAYNSTSQSVYPLTLGFTEAQLDSGNLSITYGGWQSGWAGWDQGKIAIVLFNEDSQVLTEYDLGWFSSTQSWSLRETEVPLIAGTRRINYFFFGERYDGHHNDAYLDDAFIMISDNNVPIPGAILLFSSGLLGLVGIRRRKV